jgi:hypothetical protein
MYVPDAVVGCSAAGAMPQLGAHCSLRPLILVALVMYVPDSRLETAAGQGLTLIPLSAQLELIVPISAQLKLTLSPI